MTAELIKFLFVLLVVMLGFVMPFNALFRSDTYGETWLHLFKAMLGEVAFFHDFSGNHYDHVETVLFVVYLVVIQIMLLNLLIVILSGSHAKVQKNAEQEFKVSKALLIKHYRWAVDRDVLPAPLNIVQLIVSRLYMLADCSWRGKASHAAKRAVGHMVFWLVLGTICTAGGTILWVLSVWYSPFVWRNHYHRVIERKHLKKKMSTLSLAMRYVILCSWRELYRAKPWKYACTGEDDLWCHLLLHLLLGTTTAQ